MMISIIFKSNGKEFTYVRACCCECFAEGGPLQTEALALITAHGYQEGGSSVGAKL